MLSTLYKPLCILHLLTKPLLVIIEGDVSKKQTILWQNFPKLSQENVPFLEILIRQKMLFLKWSQSVDLYGETTNVYSKCFQKTSFSSICWYFRVLGKKRFLKVNWKYRNFPRNIDICGLMNKNWYFQNDFKITTFWYWYLWKNDYLNDLKTTHFLRNVDIFGFMDRRRFL